MNKYVEEYSDINVEGVEFFVNPEDGYLYKEATFENKVSSEELTHAFNMNDVIVVDSDIRYRANGLGAYLLDDEVTNLTVYYTKYVISTDEQTEESSLLTDVGYAKAADESEETEEVVEPVGE